MLMKLADAFVKLGNDVEFVSYHVSEIPYFPTTCPIIYIDANGMAAERIDVAQTRSLFGLVKDIRTRVSSLGIYLKKKSNDFDVVIANSGFTAYPVNSSDIPLKIYYIQAYEVRENLDGVNRRIRHMVYNYLIRNTYKLPLTQIVNSDNYKNYNEISTDYVVRPGLDLDVYYSKDIKIMNKKLKIGTIGRVEKVKGTEFVCKAMEKLSEMGVDVEFHIAFNDFDTIPHVFSKPDGDDRLASFYRDMDIIIATPTGQYGAVHYPIIESMACGTSVICTDYYPARGNNSYKVEYGSIEDVVNAVIDIRDNPENAIKKRAKALEDIQEFNWKTIGQRFLEIIELESSKGENNNDNAKQS